MTKNTESRQVSARKAFVKPELRVLDVKGTETGPVLDPSEFPGILQAS